MNKIAIAPVKRFNIRMSLYSDACLKYAERAKLLLLTLVLVCLGPGAALAENNIPKPSTSLEVGFAFHKLSQTEPDFSEWALIFIEDDKQQYGPEGQRRLFEQTKQSLIRLYRNYNTETETLRINLDAKIEIVPVSEDQENAESYLVNIFFEDGVPFISKSIPAYEINLVVDDLENKLKPIISRHVYLKADGLLNFRFGQKSNIIVSIELTPQHADGARPIEIGGETYFLMLADIKSFQIWDSSGYRKIWEYDGSEIGAELEELKSLYKRK